MEERYYWKHKIKDRKRQEKMTMGIGKKVIKTLEKSNDSIFNNNFSINDAISITDEFIYIGGAFVWNTEKSNFSEMYRQVLYKRLKYREEKIEKEIRTKSISPLKYSLLGSNKPLLTMPRFVDDVENLVCMDILQNLIKDEESTLICSVLNVVITFITFKITDIITSKIPFNMEEYDDELLILNMFTVLYWYMSDNCKLYKNQEFIDTVKANLGETLEDAIKLEESCGNKFAKAYLEYKLNEKDNTEENEYEVGHKFRTDVLSDFGRLKAENFGIEDITESANVYYSRSVEDSFINCFVDDEDAVDYINSINDIEDSYARHIIYDLIRRYLSDMSNMKVKLVEKSLTNIKHCILYHEIKERELEDDKISLKEELDRAKSKIKNLKQDIKESDKKVQKYMEEIRKLNKKLQRTSDNEVKQKEELINQLEQTIEELKRIDGKRQFEIERLNKLVEKSTDKYKELEIELSRARQNIDTKQILEKENNEECEKIKSISRDIPIDVLYNTIKNKRILLIGGDTIHKNIQKRGYNNIETLKSGDVNFRLSENVKYDLVVVFTKLVSHSAVERAESEARNSNLTAVRFNEAGINSLIYFLFMYFYGHNDIEAGKYIL